MSDFKEFKNPWSADNSEWFGEEKDKWFEEGEFTKGTQTSAPEINLENDNIVAPAGYIKYRSVEGGAIFILSQSSVDLFKSDYPSLSSNKDIKTNALKDDVKNFKIKGIEYVASFNKENGSFVGYLNSSSKLYYSNPNGLISNGRVSKPSWGETSGIYPTADGNSISGLYTPKNWDYQMSLELLKSRAAITLIASRNSHLREAFPSKNKIEEIISVWHMTDNLPNADNIILNDSGVKFFFLSNDKDAKHTGLNYDTNNVEMVQRYGPFYNNGGGDVPKGPTYILFYKATPKN